MPQWWNPQTIPLTQNYFGTICHNSESRYQTAYHIRWDQNGQYGIRMGLEWDQNVIRMD
jgi:hypothetical protein